MCVETHRNVQSINDTKGDLENCRFGWKFSFDYPRLSIRKSVMAKLGRFYDLSLFAKGVLLYHKLLKHSQYWRE
jgi:hypothetical protein